MQIHQFVRSTPKMILLRKRHHDYRIKIKIKLSSAGAIRSGWIVLWQPAMTPCFDNHATVRAPFTFRNIPLALRFTTGNPDFELDRVQFIRLKIKMVIVSAGYSNETLHLTVRDNNLLPTAGIDQYIADDDGYAAHRKDGHGQSRL